MRAGPLCRARCPHRRCCRPLLPAWQGVLLFGPPGTGKTMLAKAVAHHTTASFIRVVGSEFVQKYLGEVRRRLAPPVL